MRARDQGSGRWPPPHAPWCCSPPDARGGGGEDERPVGPLGAVAAAAAYQYVPLVSEWAAALLTAAALLLGALVPAFAAALPALHTPFPS